jgi:SpoIID/LytB domain protein
MSPRTRRRSVGALLVVLAGTLGGFGLRPVPASAAVPQEIQVDGHGWGHGRGLGQFGALGYAVDHGWSGTMILDHYYGGTVTSTMGSSPDQRVLLTGMDGRNLTVCTTAGGFHISADRYRGTRRGIQVKRLDDTRFQLYTGESCGGPWRKWDKATTSRGVRIKPVFTKSGADHMLQLSYGSEAGTRYYRGDLIAIHSSGTIRTVNQVDTEAVIRSVIAREMSPSWADLGDGRGINALRAQAVAARSYAVAGDSRFGSIATTCDSTSCQVYAGYGSRQPGETHVSVVEDPRTDLATAGTAKQIRRFTFGPVARTEFSSSSGGWTAGGDFPAVEDAGDDVSLNPNHDWSVTIDRDELERVYAFVSGDAVGDVQSIRVASRNGLGSFGGRAVTVKAVFTGGTYTVSGDDFRRMFGLNTNWFIIRQT